MKADTTITITPSVVREWEKQADDLEKQAKALRMRVEAGKILLGPAYVGSDVKPIESDRSKETTQKIKMTITMANIANESDKPVTKAQMKSRLKELGYPEDQLGNYFYTCVARLKAKRIITVLADGSIGKKPS